MAPPIRTAIIGLSSSAVTSWASNAHLPYLLSPAGKARFEIVALCNSSVESAQQAIEAYKLPAQTRAYGSPEDLAADAEVQLVVVSTRVDKHYETALPSLRAAKNVYVEWPLAENAGQARELLDLAREKGGRTVIGLQGRFHPAISKLAELVQSGKIGKVLSSEIHATGGVNDREKLSNGLNYFTDRRIGGNPITIGLGHLFDTVQHVLGDVENIQSRLQIQRPQVKLIEPSSGKVVEVVESDVPDLVFLNGALPESGRVAKGASLSVRFRRGQPFKGEPGLRWTINGEKGEVRITSYKGPAINASADDVTIEVHDFATDEVQKVDWEWGPYAELPTVARNIGALYEAYANGEKSGYADFEHAVRRHEQIDGLLNSFDKQRSA